ncbi:MAG: hypothetical protein EOO41_00050 [Methanobacteriota archaeon]|nr:MAG: hypothetical protein EOO41_00050 [Euryarchaeota archaeon]
MYSESALRDLGYSKSNFWWPCLVAPIIIGIVLRVFAYLYLIWTQRAMQATQQLWMRAPKLKPGQRPTL